MAVPRFLLDDLPATVLALLLLSFPTSSVLDSALLLASVLYSVYAMIYHICNSCGQRREHVPELKEEQVSMAASRRWASLQRSSERRGLEDLVGAFNARELEAAGYDMKSVTIPSRSRRLAIARSLTARRCRP